MYPPNDEFHGPYSQCDLADYSNLSQRYRSLPPYQMDPIQKELKDFLLGLCKTIKNEIWRNPEIPYIRKMEATLSFWDLTNQLKRIDNTHEYIKNTRSLHSSIDFWIRLQQRYRRYVAYIQVTREIDPDDVLRYFLEFQNMLLADV